MHKTVALDTRVFWARSQAIFDASNCQTRIFRELPAKAVHARPFPAHLALQFNESSICEDDLPAPPA